MTFIILALGCISVGGSEGFVIADAMLFHELDSEYVDGEGERHSGTTWLSTMGGGRCPYFKAGAAPIPEGGWEHEALAYSDEARCALFRPGGGGQFSSDEWRNKMYLAIVDVGTPYVINETEAYVTECAEPDAGGSAQVDRVEIDIDSADFEIDGDMGHITAKAGSKLIVDLTLPVCLLGW